MSKRICYLCKKDVDNEFEMGEWKRDGIDVHYYCLVILYAKLFFFVFNNFFLIFFFV